MAKAKKRVKKEKTLASIATSTNNDGPKSSFHRGSKKGFGKHVPQKKSQKGKHRFGNRFKKNYQRRPKCWIEDFRTTKLPEKGQLKGSLTIVITRAEVDDNFDYTTKDHPFSKASDDLVQNGKKSSNEIKDGKIHCDSPTEQNIVIPKIILNEKNDNGNKNKEKNHKNESLAKEGISNPLEKNELAIDQKEEVEGVGVAAEKFKPFVTVTTFDKKEDKREPFINIMRSPGAEGKTKWALRQTKDFNEENSHLRNGDCGDGIVNPYPKSKVADKYWAQRKRFFRKFDEGIQLDDESWFSVTPENIADHISARITKLSEQDAEGNDNYTGCIVLDAFCGCGGNTISFAKRPNTEISLVIAIDKDREKLRMAANNANIYDVPKDKIIFIQADAIHVMKSCYLAGKRVGENKSCDDRESSNTFSSHDDSISNNPSIELCHDFKIGGFQILPPTIDIVFLSPPWGGPSYMDVGASGFEIFKNIQIKTQTCFNEENIMNELKENQCIKKIEQNEQKREEEVVNGELLLKIASKASKEQRVVFFLPKNINGISLGRSALKVGYRGKLEMEQNVMNGKTKTVTAYFGGRWCTS